jgi:outer membrane protein TolC
MNKGLWLALGVMGAWPAFAMAEEKSFTLSLPDAITIGLRVDPIVAEGKVAEDRAKLATLRAQLDRVAIKADGTVQEQYNHTWGGQGGNLTGWAGLSNLQASVNAPLFAGFRIDSTVKRAKRLEAASRDTIRQEIKDTSLTVARAYWSVRRLDLLIATQQRALSRLQEAEGVTIARVKAGLAPPIDANRATLRRIQQVATITDLHGQQGESIAQFGAALGIMGSVTLTDEPQTPRAEFGDVSQLVAEGTANRPEVAQAALQSAAQHFAVKIAQSNFYPQLSAVGLFQYGNNNFNPESNTRNLDSATAAQLAACEMNANVRCPDIRANPNPFTNYTASVIAGGQLTMNFFDTLNTYTGQKDAKYEAARLAQEEKRIARLVDSDVRTAAAKVRHLYDQTLPLTQARDLAIDNVKIIKDRYRNGDALVIEYLDAEVELTNAEVQLSDVIAQYQVAYYELQAALGRPIGVTQ